jgi:hypothetical protein
MGTAVNLTPPETTTQAVDTAANDVRKDAENEVKQDVASAITAEPGIIAHLENFLSWDRAELEKALAWIQSKL